MPETQAPTKTVFTLGETPREKVTKLLGEFIGTFLLVFVIGCTMLTHFPGNRAALLPATSIAMTLTVMIYALGPVTGAHFNPAVTWALWLKGAIDVPVLITYILAQVAGGIAGAYAYAGVFDGKTIAVAPGVVLDYQFDWNQAWLVETVYTTMLCLTVLCVASTKANAGNEFFGLAIGLCIVAGGYSVGGISGGCFNPAVTIGLDLSNKMLNEPPPVPENGETPMAEKQCAMLTYSLCQLLAGTLAAMIHRLVYPLEYCECGPKGRPKHLIPSQGAGGLEKMVCSYLRNPILHRGFAELFGVYFIVCTVGFAMSTRCANGPFAIGAAVTIMFYCMRGASGAHLNPAVTWAVMLTHPRPQVPAFPGITAGAYITAQLLGGQLAGFTYAALFKWEHTFGLEPVGAHTLKQVAALEVFYTFVTTLVVLMLTQVRGQVKTRAFHGFAIGGVVMCGGTAVGQTSGWAFNPAIAAGVDFAAASNQYEKAMKYFSMYVGFEIVGCMLALACYKLFAHGEYAAPQKPSGEREALLEDYGPPEDGQVEVPLVPQVGGPPGPVPGGPPGPVPAGVKADTPADKPADGDKPADAPAEPAAADKPADAPAGDAEEPKAAPL